MHPERTCAARAAKDPSGVRLLSGALRCTRSRRPAPHVPSGAELARAPAVDGSPASSIAGLERAMHAQSKARRQRAFFSRSFGNGHDKAAAVRSAREDGAQHDLHRRRVLRYAAVNCQPTNATQKKAARWRIAHGASSRWHELEDTRLRLDAVFGAHFGDPIVEKLNGALELRVAGRRAELRVFVFAERRCPARCPDG